MASICAWWGQCARHFAQHCPSLYSQKEQRHLNKKSRIFNRALQVYCKSYIARIPDLMDLTVKTPSNSRSEINMRKYLRHCFYLIGFCIFALLISVLPKILGGNESIFSFYISWKIILILPCYLISLILMEQLYKIANRIQSNSEELDQWQWPDKSITVFLGLLH